MILLAVCPILSSKPYNQRKLSWKTSVIRKVDQADAHSRKEESEDRKIESARIAKGTSVQRAGSPRVRHGLGKFPNGTAAQTVSEVQIAFQAQHFGNLRCRFRGRRSILFPCKVKYRFRGRRSTFVR